MDHNNCPILSIPPEVRLQIYNYVYESTPTYSCTFTILKKRHIHTFSIPAYQWAGYASLLRTCKLINSEATPILYAKAKFNLTVFGMCWERFPPMVEYANIRHCETFRNIRHLNITLHVPLLEGVQSMLDRLAAALRLLDTKRELESCSVRLILYWTPHSNDAEVALAIARKILELERTKRLDAVKCQVYTQLWTEAMRVSRRSSFEYDSYKKFRRYLRTVRASEEHQVKSTGRAYGLRRRKVA